VHLLAAPVVGAKRRVRVDFPESPFFMAGTLKIGYDLLLYYSFRKIRPPEERR
jgi:hypothetical protein